MACPDALSFFCVLHTFAGSIRISYLTVSFRISQACPGAVVAFAWRLTLAYARDVASVPLIGSKFPCPLLVTLLAEN